MNRTNDWYTIETFGGRDYRITETTRSVACHLYLLRGSDDALIIDAGVGVGNLREVIDSRIETDVRLLLTHTHWDHIGAGYQFDRVNVHPAELGADGRVTIDTISDEFVQRPEQFVENHLDAGESFPDDFDPENFTIPPIPSVDPIKGGDVIDLGDRELELVHIPGHAPGQLGVLDREETVFHAGDLVHSGHNMYIHFQNSSFDDYVESLGRTIELRDAGAFDVLTSGHNDPINGSDLELLDDLLDGLESIRGGEFDPYVVETKWGPANKYEIGETKVLIKTSI